jgi:predicted ATPase
MTTGGFLFDAFERAGLLGWERLAEAIATEFVEDQNARLEEAGQTSNERVRLGQVFVDLTVTRALVDRDGDATSAFPFLTAAAAEMPQLAGDWQIHRPTEESPEPCIPGRMLLVGGPGQGKSTLVQHLVQGHRRKCVDGTGAVGRVVGAMDAVRDDVKERNPKHLPARVRLPLVVTLARFAAWCAKGQETPDPTVLVRYVAREIWRDAVRVDALEKLLRATPWLLVLDGLDEVPAKRDRAIALECIESFFNAYEGCIPEPLVIATTRPQGWGGEFAGFLPLYLREFELEESLTYAASVTLARYPTQPRRRERIDERLRASAKDPTVAQLLRTPLLTAIMTLLVAEEGQAPRLRWEVFQRFYETIYNREVARDTVLSRVLASQRPIVNEMHRHVGLVLHTIDERDGGSNAGVSREWLRMAARRLMEVEDDPDDEQSHEADDLIDAVEQRLVLLVERESGRFSYELQSLQEFMAAWALTTGSDAHIEARFKHVALYAHWRNVLLLAMGRLFFERSPLRERLSLGLCDWLRDNDEDPYSKNSEKMLAVDILMDGLAEHSQRIVVDLESRFDAERVFVGFYDGGSSLADPAVWASLGLPAPSPQEPTPPEMAALLATAQQLTDEIVTFEEVQLTNLRCLADVHFTSLDRPTDRGQWLVFLGENGSGKSTLLRALALALTDRDNARTALKDARAFYVRHDATHGTCTVHLRGRRFNLTIRRHDDGETADPNGFHGELPWVVAYGCRRGGALGDRDAKRAQTPYANVATLFDDDRGLVDVAAWITLQEAASANDPGAKRAYDAVTRSLGDAIGYRFLPAKKDGLWVEPKAGGEAVQFSSLSDGYLTMAGWIGDLLVRFVQRHRDLPALPDDFPKHMTGVVLIDEIDQNLHPRWQVRVIQDVRRLFERMTFVVTTHNPLTLAGARKEEVFLLTRRDGGRYEVEPAQFDPRLRTGTELFSKFFGIDGIFPNELGRALHRYGTLAGNPYRSDDEDAELTEIRQRLAREGVVPDYEPEAREKGA